MKYQLEHDSIKEYQPDIPKLSLENLYKQDPHSIEWINVYNILEVHTKDESIKIIDLILSKLRLSGVCCIIGIDFNKICELYLEGFISIDDMNNLIHNKTLYNLSSMGDMLVKSNANIKTVKTDRTIYYIEFSRKPNESKN